MLFEPHTLNPGGELPPPLFKGVWVVRVCGNHNTPLFGCPPVSPFLPLEIRACGGRRKPQKTADFRRKPQTSAENRRLSQKTAGNRRSGSVILALCLDLHRNLPFPNLHFGGCQFAFWRLKFSLGCSIEKRGPPPKGGGYFGFPKKYQKARIEGGPILWCQRSILLRRTSQPQPGSSGPNLVEIQNLFCGYAWRFCGDLVKFQCLSLKKYSKISFFYCKLRGKRERNMGRWILWSLKLRFWGTPIFSPQVPKPVLEAFRSDVWAKSERRVQRPRI